MPRIVIWNCNMGFHKKAKALLALEPDFAIVPECADPDTLRKQASDLGYSDVQWVGDNRNKGLAVFAFNGRTLSRHGSYDSRFQHFLPLEAAPAGPRFLAIWAFNRRTTTVFDSDVHPTVLAVQHYDEFLQGDVVVAGDFNSWYRTNKPSSFPWVSHKLGSKALVSAWHTTTGCRFGEESSSTHFYQKKADRGFHIDYCFLPSAWRLLGTTLGEWSKWKEMSDHVPVVVDCEPA